MPEDNIDEEIDRLIAGKKNIKTSDGGKIIERIDKESEKRKMPSKKEMETLVGETGLKRYYEKIMNILKEYVDLEEKYYPLIAIWIIGTYLHKQFPAYPYLFFNAMKGSGKTRTLKIISNLAKNGKVAGSMTEAVLFRTARKRSLCIDEFESMNAKGNENLKLLLNSAYKRGTTIERMSKKKTQDGEKQIVEEFEVYCPIAMANIRGMENVLGDRCVSIILEKSSKDEIIKLIENFEYDINFKEIRGGLSRLTENIGDESNLFGHVFDKWNDFQKKNKEKDAAIHTIHTLHTIFLKIDKTDISGRELELFFPLFIISDMCSEEILDKMIKLSKIVVKEKKEQDRDENRDVQIYDFVSQHPDTDFIVVSELVNQYKSFLGVDEKWINPTWLGRGLSRLKLVIDNRRIGNKRAVKLNIQKALEKIKMFKEKPIQKEDSVNSGSSGSSGSSGNSGSGSNSNDSSQREIEEKNTTKTKETPKNWFKIDDSGVREALQNE